MIVSQRERGATGRADNSDENARRKLHRVAIR
jgi:hypothetical protein